jgi:hypothetical protein
MPRALFLLAVPLAAFMFWGAHASVAYDSVAYDQAIPADQPTVLAPITLADARIPAVSASVALNSPAPDTGISAAAPVIGPANTGDPDTLGPVAGWMMNYYKAPAPGRVPGAIAAFDAANRNDASRLFELGFMSAVFGQNPDKIAAWLGDLDKFSGEHRKLMLEALWLSGTPEAIAYLKDFGRERLSAELGKDILAQRPAAADDRMVDRPADLAYYWGRFFATGSELPIRRITSVLPWLAEPPDAGTASAGDPAKAARWSLADAAQKSLAAQATRDFRVLEICRTELASATSQTRDYIEGVIAIAQAPTMQAR